MYNLLFKLKGHKFKYNIYVNMTSDQQGVTITWPHPISENEALSIKRQRYLLKYTQFLSHLPVSPSIINLTNNNEARVNMPDLLFVCLLIGIHFDKYNYLW